MLRSECLHNSSGRKSVPIRLDIGPKFCPRALLFCAHCTVLQSVNCDCCLWVCLFQEIFSLEPWTLEEIAYFIHSISQRKRNQLFVSSLIHVIHIQLFHKALVCGCDVKHNHSWDRHLVAGDMDLWTVFVTDFLRCKWLLSPQCLLLYHSPIHYPPLSAADMELWSLCKWGRGGNVQSCSNSRRTAFPPGLSWLPHAGPRPTYWYD